MRPRLNGIVGSRGEVALEPRAMSVLVALGRRAGEVVARAELHDMVWKDVHVTDETVNRVIFDLRKAMDDRASQPRVIETIRKVGWRLIAPVEEVVEPEGAARREMAEADPAGAEVRPGAAVRPVVLTVFVALAAAAAIWLFLSRSGPEPAAAPVMPATRPLTSYPGYEIQPAFSPREGRLAFAWNGSRGSNTDIYLRNPLEEELIRLTDDPARDEWPGWSPDGGHLAFIRSSEAGCGIHVADPVTKESRRLAGCQASAISAPVWAADGSALIFADRLSPDRSYRLYRLGIEGGDPVAVTEPAAGSFGDIYPALSPDGRQLAWVRATSRSTINTYLSPAVGEIQVLDIGADGRVAPDNRPRAITRDGAEISGLAWSPDGRDLVFASSRGAIGRYAIWRVSAAGGRPLLLVERDGALLRNPAVAGNGTLVYERWVGKVDIYETGAAGAAPRIASTRSDLNPHLDPGGNRIVFTSSRSGSREIWIAEPDGSETAIASVSGGNAESPRWSPDGTTIAFEARVGPTSSVYRVDADGGGLRRLSRPEHDDRAPTWSLDGRSIYFASKRSGEWRVWKIPAAGGEALQVTREGGFLARESNHVGSPVIFYSRRDVGGIRELSASGEDRLVVSDLAPEHWGNWEVATGRIWFVRLESGRTRVRALDLLTSEIEDVAVIDGRIARETPNLSVSADGLRILHAEFTGLGADLISVKNVF